LLRRGSGNVLTFGSLAVLAFVCLLALRDGLVEGVVAYERDTIVFYYPLAAWVWDQVHATGMLPLWSPQFFAGYPIFADGELGLGSPTVLLALLALPMDLAFVVLRLFHLGVAAVGAYALARAWRLPRTAGMLAGLTFALGSFFTAQIHHENIVRSGAWLPAILACFEYALRSTIRGGWTWVVAGSLCTALAALGLHAQILVIDLATVVGYAIVRSCVGPVFDASSWLRRARLASLVVMAQTLLGLALAAFQLVPFLELVRFSARGQGISYVEAASYSLTIPGLAQLLFPYLFRAPGNVQWGLWTHWESYLYVGVGPLMLALVALVCVRRAHLWPWVVLGALGLLLALGQYSPLNLDYVLWLTPGLGGVRAPGRWTLIVVLAMAMLAAHGLAWLEQQASERSLPPAAVRSLLPALIVSSPTLAVTLATAHLSLAGAPEAVLAAIRETYLSLPRDSYSLSAEGVYQGLLWSTDLANPHVLNALVGLFAVAVLLLIWQAWPWRALRQWRGRSLVLILVAAIDLLSFGWSLHPRESLAALGAPQPSALVVRDRLSDSVDGPFRVLTSPVMNQVAPNQLARLGLEEANGYSSLETPRQRDLLKRIFSVDDELLDLWNIRYLLEPARYGSLDNFGGVDFLASQALLHAPAGGPLGDETFRIPSGFTVRQLRMVTGLVNAVEVAQDSPAAEVILRARSGEVLAHEVLVAGRDSMEWASAIPTVQPYVRHGRVQAAGPASEPGASGPEPRELSYAEVDLEHPIAAHSIQIRSVLTPGELVVYGVALVDPSGATQQLFGHSKMKFSEIYRDADIAVLENSAAYPRAFLVPNARITPAAATSLGVMETQAFDPLEEVVFPAGTTLDVVAGPMVRGGRRAADVARIEQYAPTEVVVRVTASRDEFLVLSDAYFPGWRAFVDSQEQPLLRGDMLFRVVAVTAGEHVVTFRFEPDSLKLGAAISTLAGFVLIGLTAWRFLPRRVLGPTAPSQISRPPVAAGRETARR
jgi:hypothetical protein